MPRFIQAGSGKSKTTRASERHKLGSFYTPKVVAVHALKETLSVLTKGKTPSEILELKVLDPSVGDGVFLETVLEHFLSCIEGQVNNFDRRKWADLIQKRCLFGVDINSAKSHIRTSVSNSTLHLGCNSLLSSWGPISESGHPRNVSILCCPQTSATLFNVKQLTTRWRELIETPLAKKSSKTRLEQIYNAWLAVRLGLLNFTELGCDQWSEFIDNMLIKRCDLGPAVSRKLEQTARKYRFFHWELRFEIPCFDMICGNPPWEVIEVGDSQLDYLPNEAKYSSFVGNQYSIPTGRRIELAAAFANLAFQVLDFQGYLSFLLPSSVNYAKTYEMIRQVSFEQHANFNRFDNSTGIFEGLDKRCDFTCLTINFGKKKRLTLSASVFSDSRFDQEDIRISDKSSIRLLSGPEYVVPNFKNRVSTDVIGKILSQCRAFSSFKQEFETWNGLNSTTDRSLLRDSKSASHSIPVATGQNINTLSMLCSDKSKFGKWVSKADLNGRGYSDILGGKVWEFERLGWRKIARSDDTRTLIVSPVSAGVANMESLWSIAFVDSDFQLWCEFIWASLAFDSVARTIVNSNVSKFVLLGLPLPSIDQSTLRRYKRIRQAFSYVQSNSNEYFELVKEVNNLAFELFGLNKSEQNLLIRSYFNPQHPLICQTTDVQEFGLGRAA